MSGLDQEGSTQYLSSISLVSWLMIESYPDPFLPDADPLLLKLICSFNSAKADEQTEY